MSDNTRPPRGDLSPSSAKQFAECPQRFWFRKRARLKPGTDPSDADDKRPYQFAGIHCHRVLELAAIQAANDRAASGELRAPFTARELLDISEELPINNVDESELADARGVLSSIAPVDLSRAVAAEMQAIWHPYGEGNEPSVAMVMDRIDVDPRSGLVEVTDYKYGMARDRSELASDPQTLYYLAAVHEAWPRSEEVRRWRITYHYLAPNVKVTIDWTPLLDRLARQHVKTIWRQVLGDEFPAHIGRHCGYCPYQNRCEEWTAHVDALAKAETLPGAKLAKGNWGDLAWLLETREGLKATQKQCEGAVKRIDGVIKKRMDRGRPIKAGGFKAQMRLSKRADFDVAALPVLARESGLGIDEVVLEVGSLGAQKVKAFAERHNCREALSPFETRKAVKWLEVKRAGV